MIHLTSFSTKRGQAMVFDIFEERWLQIITTDALETP